MGQVPEEKRSYPRIKAKGNVTVQKDIRAQMVDVSEGGLSFSSGDAIVSPVISVHVQFPDKIVELKAKGKLVWKRDLAQGVSLYGVEFVDLNETKKTTLRKELIRTQIAGLLKGIKKAEVREHVVHFFMHDLLFYINEIDALAPQLLSDEPYSLEREKRIEHLNTQVLLKGYCLELLLADKAITQRVKENFRYLLGAWIYKSLALKRAFDKPRGYSGDYKVLEIIYDNKPISKRIGQYFDAHFLKSPYAVALRSRKDRFCRVIRNFLKQSANQKVRIASFASGACREIREVVCDIKTTAPIVFTCVDWDSQALEFAQESFTCTIPKNVAFTFINEQVEEIVAHKGFKQKLERQDLIYSIGILDYLPDKIVQDVVAVLYDNLAPGGKMVFSHKNREKTFPPIHPDWFCDWEFIPRNKEEVVDLLYKIGLPNASLSVDTDDFGYVFYFTIAKKI